MTLCSRDHQPGFDTAGRTRPWGLGLGVGMLGEVDKTLQVALVGVECGEIRCIDVGLDCVEATAYLVA